MPFPEETVDAVRDQPSGSRASRNDRARGQCRCRASRGERQHTDSCPTYTPDSRTCTNGSSGFSRILRASRHPLLFYAGVLHSVVVKPDVTFGGTDSRGHPLGGDGEGRGELLNRLAVGELFVKLNREALHRLSPISIRPMEGAADGRP